MSRIVDGVLINITNQELIRICQGESFEDVFGNNVVSVDKEVLKEKSPKEIERIMSFRKPAINKKGVTNYIQTNREINKISTSYELTRVTYEEVDRLNSGVCFEDVFPEAKVIGNSAFMNNLRLVHICFKENTSITIKDNAFLGCDNLNQIKVGEVFCPIKPNNLPRINTEVLSLLKEKHNKNALTEAKKPLFKKIGDYFSNISSNGKKEAKYNEQRNIVTLKEKNK